MRSDLENKKLIIQDLLLGEMVKAANVQPEYSRSGEKSRLPLCMIKRSKL